MNQVLPRKINGDELYRQALAESMGQEKKTAPGICTAKSVGIEDFLAMEIAGRPMLLAPWLSSQGLAMIHAYRGTGKTHVALGIAVAVATGGKFLKWEAPEPKGVLLIDGEMPAVALQERLASVVENTDIRISGKVPLHLITPDLQEFGSPNIADYEWQLEIARHIEQDNISLVIVDNISTLCRGGRENESESWTPVQEWALGLRAKGTSVLFIHHSGKNGQQRGTSRKEDVLDTVISLRLPPDYSPDSGALFHLHFEKARGCYGEDTKPFEAKLEDGRWLMKEIEDSTAEKVAKLLNEGMPQGEIAEFLGINKSNVTRAKQKAERDGLIRATVP